jgi:NAD(P)-dependent dehydrogenase (short-subunit alcohol dehydrogenase family)
MDIQDRTIIVTGGAGGLGASVVAALAKDGARPVAFDLRPAEGDHEVVDLADSRAAAGAVRRVIEARGGIDGVVTCAGIDHPGPLEAVPVEAWERVIAVNLLGTAAVIREALPSLIERHGHVVTVASTLAHKGVGDATAYCASKFGVVGFTRALTAELSGRVAVTMLTPGGMQTGFFDGRDEQYKPGPDAVLCDPHDVARVVVQAMSGPAGCEVRELVVTAPVEPSWP